MKRTVRITASLLSVACLIALPGGVPAQATVQPVAPPLLPVRGPEKPVELQSLAMSTEVQAGLARTAVGVARGGVVAGSAWIVGAGGGGLSGPG